MECLNSEQKLGRLTPPFIFGEGIRGNNRNNATCMDYKARYCCKSTAMFRPSPVSYLENKVPIMLPIGSLAGNVTLNDDGTPREILVRISASYQLTSSKPSLIKLQAEKTDLAEASVSGSFLGVQTFHVTGKVKYKKLPDGTLALAVKLVRSSGSDFAVIKMTLDKGLLSMIYL